MEKCRGRNEKKRALSLFVAFAVFMSMFLVPGAPGPFGVDEAYGAHWAQGFLNKLSEKNVMRGDERGDFNPDRYITRAEFIAMLNRAFGFQENKGTQFVDVDPDAWYSADISFASYQGYFQGTGEGANPDGRLTREEAVTMLCRALKIEPIPVDPLRFADSRNFAAWSRGYINAATEKGIISGYGDSTFRPGNPITRGEVAKIIATVAGEIVNQPTQAYLGYVNGNVTLSKSGAGLRNTVITGDLFITEGVLSGHVFLENVTVLGTIYISGAGESNVAASSIVLTNCDINNIIVDLNHNKKVSIIAQGNTEIKNTLVKSDAYLEENNTRRSAFNDIQLKGPTGTKLDLSGEFKEVRLMAPGNEVRLNKGIIDIFKSDEEATGGKLFLERATTLGELFIDGGVTVTGPGKVEYLSIGANGANVAQVPKEIYIKPGYTATVGGKTMGHLEAEMENMSPRIENNYPKVNDITVNTAVGAVKGNKPGTVYWAVKESGAAAPTAEEMKEPKKTETFILQSGTVANNIKAIEDGTELAARISGLKNGEDYELYVMLVDSKGEASRIRSVSFQTLDRIAPRFVAGFPKGKAEYNEDTDDHMLEIEAVASKTCTLIWALLPTGFSAPEAGAFYNNKIAGALQTGTESLSENVQRTFRIRGLSEDALYEVYIGLRDNRGNVSPVIKMSLRTKDVTPPDFEKPYPQEGTRTEKAIEIKHMVNEANVTLYWAIFRHGANFPPGTAPATTTGGAIQSVLSTDAAKRAVINGNNSVRNGNTKIAAAFKPGQFVISNLDVRTLYDLYMVLEDASGNLSTVYKMEVSTFDNLPPAAQMAFDQSRVSSEGDPLVGSNIMIHFNKPVYSNLENPKVPFTEINSGNLGTYIRMYDAANRSAGGGRIEIPIDFSTVTIDNDRGFTRVTFPTTGDRAGTDAAIVLESGGRYVFELTNRYIEDFSGNVMPSSPQSDVYRLREFKMAAPFVEIRNVPLPNYNEYDMMFEVEAKIRNASENMLWDNIFQVNRKIQFKLTEIDVSTGVTTVHGAYIMERGRFYTMQSLIQNTTDCGYPQFNDLEKRRYGISITELENVANKNSWDGSVTVTLSVVAGTLTGQSGMAALTANSDRIDFIEFMKTAVEVSIVSNPGTLNNTRFFQDREAPVFVSPPSPNPNFDSGDSTIQMDVVLDKPATVFWLAVPFENVSNPASVTADQVISGSYRPNGYKWGSFNVPSGNAKTSGFITGLVPKPAMGESRYYVFYVARANVASEIKFEVVEMKTITLPVFAGGFPVGSSPGVGTYMTQTRLATGSPDAVVYWAAYRSGIFADPATPDALTISQAGSAPDARLVDWGSFNISGGSSPQTQTAIVRNLLEGDYYDVFFTARNTMSEPTTASWTEVKAIRGITPIDPKPPEIQPVSTAITNIVDGVIPRFDGSVTVTFTKPLYYKVSATSAPAQLTAEILAANLKVSVGSITIKNITTMSGTTAVNGFTIDFTNVVNNSEISMPYLIGDGVNDAGYFKMTFVRKNPLDTSGWNVRFDPRP